MRPTLNPLLWPVLVLFVLASGAMKGVGKTLEFVGEIPIDFRIKIAVIALGLLPTVAVFMLREVCLAFTSSYWEQPTRIISRADRANGGKGLPPRRP